MNTTQLSPRYSWRSFIALVTISLTPIFLNAQQPAATGESEVITARDQKSPQPPTPERFVQETVLSSLRTIRLGQLAVEKTGNSEVRKLAARIVDEHLIANHQLMKLAKEKGIGVPPTNIFERAQRPPPDRELVRGTEDDVSDVKKVPVDPNLRNDYLQVIHRLEGLSGAEFDKAFLERLSDDHRIQIHNVEWAARGVEDADIKRFATDLLNKLHEHELVTQRLQGGGVGIANPVGK